VTRPPPDLPPGKKKRTVNRRGRRQKKTDLKGEEKKKQNKINCLWCFLGFAGDVVSHRQQGKEEGRRSLQTPPVCLDFLAASRGFTRH
jgi:hypothetical protein